MKAACFIPIKTNSERVKGKNFRLVGGIPLYQIIIIKALIADCFDEVVVDTDSEEIANFAKAQGAVYLPRKSELALNTATGNDLMVNWLHMRPEVDVYVKIHVTAPLLETDSIRDCVNVLKNQPEFDSVLTATEHYGFFWWQNMPVNYRPMLTPRTQDLAPLVEETTALYGIRRESLEKYRCRVGKTPFLYPVSKLEAVDLNTDDDFYYLDWLVSRGEGELDVVKNNIK